MKLLEKLVLLTPKPEVFAESSGPFWDDEHISKGMLDAHLNPNWDAATRKPEWVKKIAQFIRSQSSKQNMHLLDLGCGPGIYAEEFVKQGFTVSGVDFSKRSIAYAKEQTEKNNSHIDYTYQNYLTIDYTETFDVITLIYYDYGVLSKENRIILLNKIKKALKPGGKFIFDVLTPNFYKDKKESYSWYISEGSGFWKDVPHLCLERFFEYDPYTRLSENIVITDDDQVDYYRIWDASFDKERILEELASVGFNNVEVYTDLTGKVYDPNENTLGLVVTKK